MKVDFDLNENDRIADALRICSKMWTDCPRECPRYKKTKKRIQDNCRSDLMMDAASRMDRTTGHLGLWVKYVSEIQKGKTETT